MKILSRRRRPEGQLWLHVEFPDGRQRSLPASWTSLEPAPEGALCVHARVQHLLDLLTLMEALEGRDGSGGEDSAIQELVRERKSIPSHLRAVELEPADRVEALPEAERMLRDTLLMLVYRAETAMLPSLQLGPHPVPDPRSVLKALFTSDACLLPDPEAGTLTVRLHHPTMWGRERQLELLLADPNTSRTRYPDTNLRLVYEFAG